MRKISALLLCCMMLMAIFAGCAAKYKRICFDQQTLKEETEKYLDERTVVENYTFTDLPRTVPMYKISGKNITDRDIECILANLRTAVIATADYMVEHEDNWLDAYFSDFGTDVFTMSEEELERMAWEAFRCLPFLEGEYEYSGIRGRDTVSTADGEYTARVMVSFYRKLDGVRVIGDDRCDMWFNDLGLAELHIAQYKYEKTGTVNMIGLTDAKQLIKTPDAFTVTQSESAASGPANILQVDDIGLQLVNQSVRGCTILQPVYVFSGMAIFPNGARAEFSSVVIAIS